MRKSIQWITVFLLGGITGWQAHQYWPQHESKPQSRTQPHHIAIQASTKHAGTPATRSTTKAVETLLRQRDYEGVTALYADSQSGDEPSDAGDIKARILRHAAALETAGETTEAVELLNLFLEQAYRDPEALELLARVYTTDHQYLAAVTTWYEVRALAYRPEHLKRILDRIRTIVTEYTEELESQDNEQALLEFYLQLTELEPDYVPYFIGLAKAQLAVGDEESARQSLQLVVDDPEFGTQALELLAGMQPSVETPEAPEEAIPLTPAGNQFLVDVWINDGSRLKLLIDTGASLTVITPQALASLGVARGEGGTERQVRFNTAGGPVEAPVIRFEDLTVGDYTVSGLDVGILELADTPEVDGLLGMNFLKHFQFFIDQHEHLLRLSPKP